MKINLILAYTFQTIKIIFADMCIVPCSKFSNMTTVGKILNFNLSRGRFALLPFPAPLYYYYVLQVILNMHHVCGSLNMQYCSVHLHRVFLQYDNDQLGQASQHDMTWRLTTGMCILYSQKYWRELNLVVEPQIAIAKIFADLNLVVQYGIAICIYVSRKFRRILIWRL